MKSGIIRKWWLLQHINDPAGTWFPQKLITLPGGYPLAFMFFSRMGAIQDVQRCGTTG